MHLPRRCPPFATHVFDPKDGVKTWQGDQRGVVVVRTCLQCGAKVVQGRLGVNRGRYVPEEMGRVK